MKFYNPMFGVRQANMDSECASTTIVATPQAGEHGYCNPVHINTHDMEAATNAILQKVTPLVKIDDE
ncbi:hypothetical protein Trydic_g18254 [Trypoxylus dichotomus]